MSPPDSADALIFAGESELARLMRRFAWEHTPLGPPEQWPQSLRAVVRIVLTSRYAMWMSWGPERTFLYNDAYAAMTLGAKHPWALGRPSHEVWAEIWPQIGPRIDHVIATGDATWDERLLLFLERSGYREETYHTFSYSPIADDAGAIRGHLCVVTEETERVLDERRLAVLKELGARLAIAQSEAEVCRAAEMAADIAPEDLPFLLIYLTTPDAMLIVAGACGVPEGSARPAAATPRAVAAQWLGPDERDPMVRREQPAPSPVTAWRGRPWGSPVSTVAFTPLQQSGQPEPHGVLVAGLNPHRAIDDKYRSFIALFAAQVSAGIANARAYEEERNRARALVELDRAKTIFFSNVSHEFRTPLTLMLGPTEQAVHANGALAGSDLEMVYRNQVRLLKLVNTLLDFSRLEAGRMTASIEPVDLAALTAELAASFRSAIERGGVHFEVECPPLGRLVPVDPALWEKVVLNLLSNAFKFTLKGEIRLSLALEGDVAVLRVRDTGVGIASADLSHVFERFHRVEVAQARTYEGSGIGLALVQDLVALHGGTIGVESTLGLGTTFTLRLPSPPAAVLQPPGMGAAGRDRGSNAFVIEAERWLPDAAVASDGTAHGVDTARAGQAVADAHRDTVPRVLIADDNADMRDYASRLLRPHWQVRAVGDGLEALAEARKWQPALVLTDVMMPNLDGFGLLKALRADPATAAVPVIMLSARAGDEAHAEALEAGVDDYLVKPFSARELVARVATHLERARARRQAVTERDRFFTLLRDVPAIVNYLEGPELVFAFVHPRTTAMLGGRDVFGQSLLDAFPEQRGQAFASALLDVYRTGRIQSGRAARAYLDGEPDARRGDSYWDYTYLPVHGADGTIEGVMTFDIEVTDQVRTLERLEQATRAKDEFLAMLGHELRNPLAPIMTALHLLRMKQLPAVERERTIIERQTAHLVRLVDDLLDVSRIARGRFELKKERCEIAVIVAQAIEQASPLLEGRKQQLDVRVPQAGLLVDADPARLAQAIANLLTNAAKYSEPRTTITLTSAPDGDDVAVEVTDQGIGIDADMLPRVFDMFVQEGQALDRSMGGLGLGLSIVRNIMALHGGSATVTSAGRGHGAVFTLRMPAARPDVVAAHVDDAARAPAPPTDGRGLNVLVVDDNDDAARLLAEVLRVHGYCVTTAFDGPSALQLVADRVPDIAILDIGLPGMDGYELAARLREDPKCSSTNLVAVTGYGQVGGAAKAAGFEAHLVKPVDPARLTDLLRELRSASADERAAR